MGFADNFMDNLRIRCEELNLTQQQLAAMTGIHYVTICTLLKRKNDPNITTCERLAKATGMDPATCFCRPRKPSRSRRQRSA